MGSADSRPHFLFISQKFSFDYSMLTPALINPVKSVATSIPAVTLAENTSSNLVPAVTGITNPVVNPLEITPIATAPVSGGARVTIAPGTGEKTSLGVGELYNWAVIVTVDPTRDTAAAVL